jgi:hypothetical protein
LKVAANLQKIAKFLYAEPSIAHNATHRKCTHWIMSWDRENADTVCHNDVCTLPYDAKAGFFESGNSSKMVNPGNLRHACPRSKV